MNRLHDLMPASEDRHNTGLPKRLLHAIECPLFPWTGDESRTDDQVLRWIHELFQRKLALAIIRLCLSMGPRARYKNEPAHFGPLTHLIYPHRTDMVDPIGLIHRSEPGRVIGGMDSDIYTFKGGRINIIGQIALEQRDAGLREGIHIHPSC